MSIKRKILYTIIFLQIFVSFCFVHNTYAADTTLYVNTASTAGGNCTTNATSGANRACATLSAAEALLPGRYYNGRKCRNLDYFG